jgi:hypothetical protein
VIRTPKTILFALPCLQKPIRYDPQLRSGTVLGMDAEKPYSIEFTHQLS